MKLMLMMVLLANDGTVLQQRGPYHVTMRECDAMAELTAKIFTVHPPAPGYPHGVKVVQCKPWKGRRA